MTFPSFSSPSCFSHYRLQGPAAFTQETTATSAFDRNCTMPCLHILDPSKCPKSPSQPVCTVKHFTAFICSTCLSGSQNTHVHVKVVINWPRDGELLALVPGRAPLALGISRQLQGILANTWQRSSLSQNTFLGRVHQQLDHLGIQMLPAFLVWHSRNCVPRTTCWPQKWGRTKSVTRHLPATVLSKSWNISKTRWGSSNKDFN